MSTFIRRDLPVLIMSVIAIIWAIDIVVAVPALEALTAYGQVWVTLIGTFTVFVGAITLLRYNFSKAKKLSTNDPEKYFAFWSIFLFAVLVILGMAGSEESYSWLASVTYSNVDYFMETMVGLWMAATAVRVLRVRSFDSFLFFAASILLFLNFSPIAEVISPLLAQVGVFVSDSWLEALNRSLIMGVGIGGLIAGIRAIAGMERGPFEVE